MAEERGDSMKNSPRMVEQAEEYLKFKRKLGYELRTEGKELLLFARYAEQAGHTGPLTTELVVQWAKLPEDADPVYWARRYNVVRRFAKYRFLFDAHTEIPPKSLLGSEKRRLPPHIYSNDEILSLVQAASQLRPESGLRPHTYVTLFGLLLSTGLRISEALKLSQDDVNLSTGILSIKRTKFRKSRLVPVHPSTVSALRRYSKLRNACHRTIQAKVFFLSEKGTPLNYRQVLYIFTKLRRGLGWTYKYKRPPRIHDFRHTFAVKRLLMWYEEGALLDQKILALSTYLGHVQVTDTYWYLSASPELLAVVSKRFENFAHKEIRRDTLCLRPNR
jgi:integrase